MPEQPEVGGHYGAHYREFADEVYSALRRAEFGDDFGQNNWLTLPELERFASQLELTMSSGTPAADRQYSAFTAT